MADETKPTAKKKRVVNRTQKPVFAVVTYTDENGEPLRLIKANLSIKVEKDMEKIVEIMEAGEGGTVIKLDMPAPKPRTTAETPAA